MEECEIAAYWGLDINMLEQSLEKWQALHC